MMSDDVVDVTLNKTGNSLDWLIFCGVACITVATPLYLYMTSAFSTESYYFRGFWMRAPSFAEKKKDDDLDISKEAAIPTLTAMTKPLKSYNSDGITHCGALPQKENLGPVFFAQTNPEALSSTADLIREDPTKRSDEQENIDSHWENIDSLSIVHDTKEGSDLSSQKDNPKPWYRRWF